MYEETGMPTALPEPTAVQAHSWDRERGLFVPVGELVETRTERLGTKEVSVGSRGRRFLKGPI